MTCLTIIWRAFFLLSLSLFKNFLRCLKKLSALNCFYKVITIFLKNFKLMMKLIFSFMTLIIAFFLTISSPFRTKKEYQIKMILNHRHHIKSSNMLKLPKHLWQRRFERKIPVTVTKNSF